MVLVEMTREMTLYMRLDTGHVFSAPKGIFFVNKNAGLATQRGLLQTVPYRIIMESEVMWQPGHVFGAPKVIFFVNKNAGLATQRGLLPTVPYRIIMESEVMWQPGHVFSAP